jgi:hypothetical protein
LGADLYWVALVALATAVMWPQQISNTSHTAG